MISVKTVVFTGGHHTSALVVAQALKQRGWQVVWIGHRRSMWGDQADSAEYTEVTAAGIEFHNLWAGKFYHTYNPLKLLLIPVGFIHSLLLLLWIRPAVIVSFGGYLAVPVVLCGWVMGIPAVTHEQTVVVGWANRVISKFANRVAVAWPSSLAHFPKGKAVYVGLPVRPEILALRKTGSVKKVYDPITVFITGGKQGAHVINELIFANIHVLSRRYKIIHQTGSSTIYNDASRAQHIKVPGYETFAFDSKSWMAALGKSDVVVSRAGAHAVYELGLLGKRCVLIPIPWVSHQEQHRNAQVLVEAGGGVILEQDQLSLKNLVAAIEQAKHLTPAPMNLPLDAVNSLLQLIEQVVKH